MHRVLHGRIEILHADRDPVEPEPREKGHASCLDPARIDLDRAFAIRLDLELRAQQRAQLGHLFAAEEGRRAAAPVHLADAPVVSQQRTDARDLLAEALDILRRLRVAARHDFVARAVVAQRVAERDVHVDRKRLCDATDIALGEPMAALGFSESFHEPVRGRIRGIARPADVVSTYQYRVDDQIGSGIAHAPTAGGAAPLAPFEGAGLPAPCNTLLGALPRRLT